MKQWLGNMGKLRLGTALSEGVGFSLDAFLAAQSDGFAFDFTKTDRFFQENTGPTLADDTTEAIGLALSSRLWNGKTLAEELAEQEELRGGGTIVNTGTPPSSATYNTATGVGSISRTDVGNQSQIDIPVPDSTATYAVDIEVTLGSLLGVRNRSNDIVYYTPISRVTIFAAAPGSGIRLVMGGNPSSASFVLHSVKLVPGKHATQATGSLKPTRQVFYGYSDDQPELLVNGSFDADANWNKGPGWTISGGVATKTAGSASSLSSTSMVAEIGKTYRITCSVTRTAGIFTFGFAGGGGSSPSITATGTYTFDITATVAREFIAYGNDVSAGTVDSISVKEVPASRITTAAKGDGSDDNLLTTYTANVQLGSELVTNGGFDSDSGWTKGTGWTISGGIANKAAGTGSHLTLDGFVPVPGTTYCVVFTMTKSAGGGFQVDLAGGLGTNRTTSGTYTEYIKAVNASSTFKIWGPADIVGTIDNVSVKEVTNQDNFIVAYVNVPTTISAFQYITNAANASGGERFGIGINTDGTLGIGVGSESPASGAGKVSSGDLRGKSVVIGMSFDGSTMRAFVDDEEVLSVAQSGVPVTTIPLRICSGNANGTALSFFSGQIEQIVAGREFLTLERYLQIRNALINQ